MRDVTRPIDENYYKITTLIMKDTKRETKEIKISDIKLYEHNNKTHNKDQIELLKKTITEFWFTNPVLLSDKNECIWGHGRIQAMQELWKEEVPAVYINDLTPKQVRKLRLLDNKIAELAEDNIEAIKFELEELEDQELNELYDLDITTLDPDKEEEEDNVPAIPENIIVEKWDIFQLWEHRLMCWDSTSIDDVEKLMDWEKADMVFTDPPYNIGFWWSMWATSKDWIMIKQWDYIAPNQKYDEIKNDEMSEDEFKSFMLDIIWIIQVKCKWAWYISFWTQTLDQLLNPLKELWMYWKSIIVWMKNQSTLSWKDFKWRYEPIVYWRFNDEFYWERYNEEDIWEFQRTLKNDLHPTMKPIPLIEKAINSSSKKGYSVLDLFWWSWSTLIASEKTNRKCYMMELDEKYIQVILKRYKDYTDWKKEIKCINRTLDLTEILW